MNDENILSDENLLNNKGINLFVCGKSGCKKDFSDLSENDHQKIIKLINEFNKKDKENE